MDADLERELITINQSILQFKQKEIDFRQRLSCIESQNLSCSRSQKDEKFEKRINALEGQYSQQEINIDEIKSILGKLVKKVNKLHGDTGTKNKTTVGTNKQAPNSKKSSRIKHFEPGSITDLNGQLSSNDLSSEGSTERNICSSAYSFSQKRDILASVDETIQATAIDAYKKSPPEVQCDLNAIGNPKSSNAQNPLDVKNKTATAKHVYNNDEQYQVYSCHMQVPPNNIWFPANIPAKKTSNLNRMESHDPMSRHGHHMDDNSDTSDENVEHSLGVPFNTLETERGINSTSCYASNILIKKTLKNNFGLKTSRTNLMFDNRVRLLTDQTCYEGLFIASVEGSTEEVPPLNNITPTHSEQPTTGDYRYEYEASDIFEDGEQRTAGIGESRKATIDDWHRYTEQITMEANLRVKSGVVQRGWHGHDVTLVLDACEHMRGDKFVSMKSAARRYIEGVKQIQRTRGLVENVGIAVFCGRSRLLHEHTSDYDLLLSLIDELEPEGEAPIIGGLLMGMATVLAGTTTCSGGVLVQGHMIMFTDGTSSDKDLISTDSEVLSVIRTIAEHSIKVYYVQLGEQQLSVIMEQAVKETKGKVISISEMYRLIRMSQLLGVAARVAGEMKFLAEEPNRDFISQKIYELTRNPEDQNEDCIDFVVEFTNSQLKEGIYKELKCRTLHLGDRVRRGPLWTYGEQDGNCPGTVIGQHDNGWVRVMWDNGHNNIYRYEESSNTFNLRRVNEKRILVDEMIAVGCRVVRGGDWRYGDDDGGFGTMGTVLNVKPEGRAVVRWDSKKMGIYKMGYNGFCEIMVVDESSTYGDEQIPFTDLEGRSQNESFTYSNSWNQAKDTDSNGEDMHSQINVPAVGHETKNASWEYKDNKDSEWKKYPLDINYKIENAFKKKPTEKTNFKMDMKTYIINFAKNIQVNPRDGTEIEVRRSV
ncbi:Hypothetical predicted protein [Mytilus galloprovincialis]|uniref:MIB/HERC2 domain-containing protein n=1 Tax=Mytilus galloprovincialis TaxID=29158 RepID=A0A8B6C1H9_MYTGA|nr:Hypothetical predicted protein [Mytilus galloprovincialis]